MLLYLYAALAGAVGLAAGQSTVNTITTTFVGGNGVTTVPWPPTCSAVNGGTSAVYDSNAQELYYFMCGAATSNPSLATVAAANSWRDCFALCDNAQGCTSFSFNPSTTPPPAFGEGPGNCVLKAALPPSFSQTDALTSTRIGVIRYRYGTY